MALGCILAAAISVLIGKRRRRSSRKTPGSKKRRSQVPNYSTPVMPITMNVRNRLTTETVAACAARGANHSDEPCQLASSLQDWCFGTNPTNPGSTLSKFVVIRCKSGVVINDPLFRSFADEGGIGDLLEVPAGSGVQYGVMLKETVARGFPNEHTRCLCVRVLPANGNE
jgi:hypothetical protein